MVMVNWNDPDMNSGDYELLPEGKYICKVLDVEERETQKGIPMWSVTWVVDEGKHENRRVFDNIVFSKKGTNKAKILFKAVGRETEGSEDLKPEMILSKRAKITVEQGSYTNRRGEKVEKNMIPFAGFESLNSSPAKKEPAFEKDEDIPF